MNKISVPKSQQTDKSDVCYLATQLELKVIRMVMNEKYFPKRARFIITNQIIESTMNVAKNFKDVRASYNSWRGSLNGKKCYETTKSMDDLFNKLFIEDWRIEWYEQTG